VNASDLIHLLQEFYRDKVAIRDRHIAGAQRVSHYNFNNTYQYVINREDTQVAWLRSALEELGADIPAAVPPPDLPAPGRGADAERAVIEDDARHAQAFLDRWTARVQALRHARHRKMLEVILGETLEQRRFFEQMIDGREDVLGRRTGGPSTGGGVLPVRWLRQ
jgi:hypothetical protein